MTELIPIQERELRHIVANGEDAAGSEEASHACDALVDLGLLEFLGYDDGRGRDIYKASSEGEAWVREHPVPSGGSG